MAHDKPPLWKQALGAVIGASLALALYGGYQFVEPHLTAYLTIPQAWIQPRTDEVVRVNDNDESAKRMERRERRAREIAANFSQRKLHQRHQYKAVIHDPPANGWGTEEDLAPRKSPTTERKPTPWAQPTAESLKPLSPTPATASHRKISAPVLPDSGGEIWLVAMLALFAAGVRLRRGRVMGWAARG